MEANKRKTKILIFADFYYPGYKAGGPIQSIYNLTNGLKQYCDVYIVTRDRDTGESQSYLNVTVNEWNKINDTKVYYLSPDRVNYITVRNLTDTTAPDIIYLNSFFSKFSYLVYFSQFPRKTKFKILIAPRGEFNEAALNIGFYKKKIFIKIFQLLFSRSRNLIWHATNLKECDDIGLLMGKTQKVFVVTNTGKNHQQAFSGVRKTPGMLNLITVARIHPIKNLEFIASILRSVKQKHPDFKISWSICGYYECPDYLQRIEEICSNFIQFSYLGDIANNQISEVCMNYHLFALPSLGENFGHAIYEAFLSGLPVIISDKTPWVNLSDKNIGFDIPLNDLDSWEQCLIKFIQMDEPELNDIKQTVYNYGKALIQQDNTVERFFKSIKEALV